MQKARRHPQTGAPTACGRTVSGSLSPRCPRCFSPFPHGTRALSVSRECLALADGAACFGQGSSDPALLRVPARLGHLSRTGLSPAPARLSRRVPLCGLLPSRRPYNPARASTPAVWAGPLSLAATRGVTLVFLSSGYLDVSVRRVRPRQQAGAMPSHGGLPHSGVRGSQAARASPRPFAACRALHRLREPRASPVRPLSLAARDPSRDRVPSRAASRGPPTGCPYARLHAGTRMGRTCHTCHPYAITPSVCNACIHVRASRARRRVCVYVSSFLRPAALSRNPGRFPPMMSKNRPPDPRGTAWRMRESNPRPPACKAGALAI